MTARTTSERAPELLAELQRHYADSEVGVVFEIDAIEELTNDHVVVRGSYSQAGRPGATGAGIIPGPVQMAMADGFGWILSVAPLPPGSDAFTIDMSMQFLRPLPVGPYVARCSLLRWSPRRSVVTVDIAPGHDEPTATFITAAFSPRAALGDAGGGTGGAGG